MQYRVHFNRDTMYYVIQKKVLWFFWVNHYEGDVQRQFKTEQLAKRYIEIMEDGY